MAIFALVVFGTAAAAACQHRFNKDATPNEQKKEQNASADTNQGDTATVIIVSSKEVARVNAIKTFSKEKQGYCFGGQALQTFRDPEGQNTMKLPFQLATLPLDTTNIGICSEPSSSGAPHALVAVEGLLKAGQRYLIVNDVFQSKALAPDHARLRIKSTRPALQRIIAIQGTSASCNGGNPVRTMYVDDQPSDDGVYDLDVPTSVTKIGLCGAATSTGQTNKEIELGGSDNPEGLQDGEFRFIDADRN
jgi:hypothetical protein